MSYLQCCSCGASIEIPPEGISTITFASDGKKRIGFACSPACARAAEAPRASGVANDAGPVRPSG